VSNTVKTHKSEVIADRTLDELKAMQNDKLDKTVKTFEESSVSLVHAEANQLKAFYPMMAEIERVVSVWKENHQKIGDAVEFIAEKIGKSRETVNVWRRVQRHKAQLENAVSLRNAIELINKGEADPEDNQLELPEGSTEKSVKTDVERLADILKAIGKLDNLQSVVSELRAGIALQLKEVKTNK